MGILWNEKRIAKLEKELMYAREEIKSLDARLAHCNGMRKSEIDILKEQVEKLRHWNLIVSDRYDAFVNESEEEEEPSGDDGVAISEDSSEGESSIS